MGESTIRLERKAGYTVLQNDALRDKRLSLKAKGLFAVIASRPPNWEYSISGLAVFCAASRDAVYKSILELEAAGYLERQQQHTARGRFASCVYVLHDNSTNPPPDDEDMPFTPIPSTVKPSTVESATVEPASSTPLPGNPAEVNKDLSKERLSKPPIVPQGGRKHRESKTEPTWKPERFAKFWDFYSRQVRGESKQAAIKAWDKLKPDDVLIVKMGHALQSQLSSEQWQQGIGIPYASTWLNQRRFEDAIGPVVKSPSGSTTGGWAADPEAY